LGTIYWAISFGKALVQLGTCDSIPITEEWVGGDKLLPNIFQNGWNLKCSKVSYLSQNLLQHVALTYYSVPSHACISQIIATQP